jgi:hypothetical protein
LELLRVRSDHFRAVLAAKETRNGTRIVKPQSLRLRKAATEAEISAAYDAFAVSLAAKLG